MMQPSISRVPTVTADDVVAFLLQLLLALVALLVVAWMAHTGGPVVRRRWPRLAEVIAWAFPLPCTHSDMSGVSVTYRERRLYQGQAVIHTVCPRCGTARPLVHRTADGNARAVVTGRPAHERMRATPTPPVVDEVVTPFRRGSQR